MDFFIVCCLTGGIVINSCHLYVLGNRIDGRPKRIKSRKTKTRYTASFDGATGTTAHSQREVPIDES